MHMSSANELLKYLQDHPGYTTVKKIAFDLGVTPRTIQNYLKTIRAEHSYLIITSQKGVRLTENWEQDRILNVRVPQNYEERKMWILRKCLLNGLPVTMEQASQYFGISYATLLSEINRMRKELAPDKLRIGIHDDVITFIGSEYQKRAYISKMIYEEAGPQMLSIEKLNDMFPEYDANKIRQIISDTIRKYQYYIDEFSLINVVLHVLISLNTYQDKTRSADSLPLSERTSEAHFTQMVEDMCTQLEAVYHNHFTNDEKYQFYVLFTTRATRDTKEMQSKKIEDLTDKYTADLLDKIINSVRDVYQLNLDVPTFKIGFAMHLYNMLIRANEQVKLHNPLLENIKITSPFIYDIAIYISGVITRETGLRINDDEISYIALHVGVRLEEIHSIESRLNTFIVCPDYYAYSSFQVRKIPDMFKDVLYISQIVQNPDELSKLIKPDLIISTVPLPHIKTAVVQISPLVTETDRNMISKSVQEVKHRKERDNGRSLMHSLFSESVFKKDALYDDQEEAMKDISRRMQKAGFVGPDYYEKMMEREVISPTNFGRIAIPHPIDYYSRETVISVTILKKPIVWNNSSVSIILAIAVCRKDYPIFQNIFSFLTSICMDATSMERLYKAKDYNDFMRILMDLYEKE